MKITKIIFAAAIVFPLLFGGCASTKNTAGGGIKVDTSRGPRVAVSLHKELPDTSSTIITEAQDMNEGLSALEFSKIMGNGINLGNTMEAYRAGGTGTEREATYYEQLWGQPVTTSKIIQGYKAAGFDTLRIPVAWTNAMDYDHGDYVIGKGYLDRVETIVNWALDAGMYVIINDHWDGGWWGMFGSATQEIRDSAMEMYEALWTQVGQRFKNYSYRLIFEGGNEELGDRLNDNNSCWDSGILSENERYETAYKINQKFVDVIRGLGGNNSSRFLLIPGYNTDVTKTCDGRYKMPIDSVDGRLFISVHYYDPSPLCLGEGDLWGTKGDLNDMNAMLAKMKKFTDAGYGVIIGEYGVLPDKDLYKAGTKVWHENFLDNCDYYNFCPVLWDIGSTCWYNKSTCELRHPEIKEMYEKYSYAVQSKKGEQSVHATAKKNITQRLEAAPASFTESDLEGRSDIGIAYIMYADSNWGKNYSVGDQYKPSSSSKGIKAVDVGIKDKGDYTVSLDFSETSKDGTGSAGGFSFCALGIANGEALFPGWVIEIKEIRVNGKAVNLTKKNYTSSDDGKCTRSNIVNEWVPSVPNTARVFDGNLDGTSATILDKTASVFKAMKTFEIDFYYGPQK